MNSDTLIGEVTAKEDGYMILSIPYDPGFRILVDGRKTEAALFEDMMIAVPLKAGTHSISLRFYPQGMTAGILITLFSILVFATIWILERKQNRG